MRVQRAVNKTIYAVNS